MTEIKPTAIDQSEMELFEQPAESGQLWLNLLKSKTLLTERYSCPNDTGTSLVMFQKIGFKYKLFHRLRHDSTGIAVNYLLLHSSVPFISAFPKHYSWQHPASKELTILY